METSAERTLVLGDPVITLGSEHVIPDGALILEGRKIVAVGARTELEQRGPFARTLGSQQHVVLPGLPNAHIHSGIFNEDQYIQYPVERGMPYYLSHSLTEEEYYHRTLLRLATCLRGGQTMVLDFGYGNPQFEHSGFDIVLQAFRDIGMRASLAVANRDRNRIVHTNDEAFLQSLPDALRQEIESKGIGDLGDPDDLIETFKHLYDQWHDPDAGIAILLAPDWIPCTSDELYMRNRRLANEYGVRLTTHACESMREMVFSLQNDGKKSMRRLADIGFLGPDVSIAHFIWATDEDIQILADSGAIAINNAAANLRTSNGIMRVRDILNAGGRVAFGTDASSFSNSEDFLQELRLAELLQRPTGKLEPGRIPALDILQSAVLNGAEACGYEGVTGPLESGYSADLILLRTDRLRRSMRHYPTRAPYEIPITPATVLDYANSTDIELIIIGGEIVLENGEVLRVDEDKSHVYLEGIQRTRQETGYDIAERLDPHLLKFYQSMPKAKLTPASTYNIKDIKIDEQ